MKYTVKKITAMLITLILVSFCVFLAFSVISGDPATSLLGMNATPDKVEALRTQMGLNDPVIVQYIRWASSFVKGDMGISYNYQTPVSALIGDKIPITLTLTGMAFCMMLLLSIPLGIYGARHESRWVDKFITIAGHITMSIPSFFLGILLTFFLGLVLHLFTPGGYVSYETNFLGFLGYLIVPAIAIALPKAAMTAKLLRSSLLEQKNKEYVRTAYSRGNTTKDVFYKHILKNALIPVITFMGMTLSDMLVGSIIVEQVFGIPGLGRILLTSIAGRDYPVVQAIVVCITCFVILATIVVDILYGRIDPRTRIRTGKSI